MKKLEAHHDRACFSSFTLVELLIVIAIISLMMTMLLPALSSSRDVAKRIRCLGNLRQIYTYAANYTESSNGWCITSLSNTNSFWTYDYYKFFNMSPGTVRNTFACGDYAPYKFELGTLVNGTDPCAMTYGGHGGLWGRESSANSQYYDNFCLRLFQYPSPSSLVLFADSAYPAGNVNAPGQSYTLYGGERLHLRHSSGANIVSGAGDAKNVKKAELLKSYNAYKVLGADLETLY